MKLAALAKKFAKEVELLDDRQDYTRTSVWLKSLGVNPGLQVPASVTGRNKAVGIIPYLVHSVDSEYKVEIDFD